MAIDINYLAYIEQQLSDFPDWKARKMFGGVGFFRAEAMFGVIKNGIFMLRSDAMNLGPFAGQ